MMQQHQEGISTTGTSSTKQAGAARGSRVMDNRLRPWALYDLSGAPTADTLDTMKDHFRRFRGLRQKGVEGGWREAPTYLPQEGSRTNVSYNDARVGHRERGHDDIWRREEDRRGQQCVQRSSGYLQQRQQQEGDRHTGNVCVLAGHDEDDLLNRYWDTEQELDEALDQAARAAGETAQLRQSNREILARLRMLERSVHGQLRTGTQPRDPAPGTGGLMARRSRREGRPTHAPAQETELTLES
ncbi:hypothetical protein PC111_g21711 [Phytophthora cactorum]|nr:hypothetical protein PC111_g21711 [Phytophthora cactorum]KAG2830450.1 hypothetical protein PC112_g7656 [Phytophthora cactorum]